MIHYTVLGIPASSCVLIKKKKMSSTLCILRTIFYFKLYRYFIRVIKDSHIFVTTFFIVVQNVKTENIRICMKYIKYLINSFQLFMVYYIYARSGIKNVKG